MIKQFFILPLALLVFLTFVSVHATANYRTKNHQIRPVSYNKQLYISPTLSATGTDAVAAESKPSDNKPAYPAQPSDNKPAYPAQPSNYRLPYPAQPSNYRLPYSAQPSNYPSPYSAQPSNYPSPYLAQPSNYPSPYLAQPSNYPSPNPAQPSYEYLLSKYRPSPPQKLAQPYYSNGYDAYSPVNAYNAYLIYPGPYYQPSTYDPSWDFSGYSSPSYDGYGMNYGPAPYGGYPSSPYGGYPSSPYGGYPSSPYGGYPSSPYGGYPSASSVKYGTSSYPSKPSSSSSSASSDNTDITMTKMRNDYIKAMRNVRP